MQNYGKVCDYDTGQELRDADAYEWLRTMDRIGAGHPEGAWKDETGRVVYVQGGPDCPPAVAEAIAEAGVV